MLERIQRRLGEPRDIASLAALRILLGLLLFASTIRFVEYGWLERFYEQPTFFFRYWGFEWVPVPSLELMYALHAAMAVAALLIALGLFYRVATVAFFVTFTWVELVDVTNYLNHYYLVSLIALFLCFVPLHGAWSLDALRKPSLRRTTLPAWMLYLFRFQIAVVYIGAGLAKAGPDWLLHAQPLGIWLAARTDTPIVGPLFAIPETAYLMSWAGFLHDLLIVPLLLWRRTRPYAFAVLLAFHAGTHLLFTIGIFPLLMPLLATTFFPPSWPRRINLGTGIELIPPVTERSPSRLLLATLAAFCALQVALPLRAHLYGGDVLWHEQGMRWSWRVMVREKNGSVTFRARAAGWDREQHISPSRYLTAYQEREMSGQPDMILALAHRIADDLRARGEEDVEVRADALVSINGRTAAPMIDPTVDLASIDDGIAPADWILPLPEDPPLEVRSRLLVARND